MTDIAADTQLYPLLHTKLFPASGDQERFLPRHALLERLQQVADRRLVILSAPAGAGKSTVLGQYRQRLQDSGADVAWLSCDSADNEPRRFFQYLVGALTAACAAFGGVTRKLLARDIALTSETLLEAIVEDFKHVDTPLYVMLDDFHQIRYQGLGEAAYYFIKHLPSHVHVLVSTRYQPRFIDTRPGLGDWAVSLNAEDLRLSLEEAGVYLRNIRDVTLSDTELSQLYERTEGWITALHLASLALQKQVDRAGFLATLSGAERDIADYLGEDVLAKLPESVQLFLDQTSVLDEFNADICDALTGRHDAHEMIKRLRSEQLFIIALDEQGQWFRYHHLFAEFLQRRLSKRADPAPLLSAAARWCESHELVDKSVKYALKARDYAFAAELLERQGSRLIAGNRVYGVLAILKDIPATVIHEHAVFQIFFAWQLAFEHKFSEAETLIEDVSSKLSQRRSKPMPKGLLDLLVASQLLKALVLLYQDKLEACLKVSSQWLSVVPSAHHVFRASLGCVQAAAQALLGDYGVASHTIAAVRQSLEQGSSEYLSAMAALIESLIAKEHGELAQALAQIDQARQQVQHFFGVQSRANGVLALACADVLYAADQHQAILSELPLATTCRDVATPLELLSRGQLVMARSAFFQGQSELALNQLEQWLREVQGVNGTRIYAIALSQKVQFLLWLRRPNEAQRVLSQLERMVHGLPQQRYADVYVELALAQARIALTEHRGDKALSVLENLMTMQTQPHQRERHWRLALLLSVAHWRKGNNEQSFELLEQIVGQIYDKGYRRLFLDDALWLLPLFDAWSLSANMSASAQAVSNLMRQQCLLLSVDPKNFEENQSISFREREVLRLVAAGLSNRDIAQTVHLSEATIKWHLHNLFAKLGVRSRTQAVLKGKTLGLLSEA